MAKEKSKSSDLSDLRLVIHFKTEEPINFVELSRSFLSVADLCESSVSKSMKKKGKDNNIGLYVSNIENNCFVVEIAQIVNEIYQALSALDPDASKFEQLKVISQCARDFSTIMREFMKVVDNKHSFKLSTKFPKKLATAVFNILSFLAKSDDGELDIKTMDYEKSEDDRVDIIAEFSNKDLKKAKQGVDIVLDLYNKTSKKNHEKVLLKFVPASTKNPKGVAQAIFWGIVEKIHKEDSFPVYMSKDIGDEITNSMINEQTNPFEVSYLVDVDAKKDREDKLKSYEIVKLHEIILDGDNKK